MDIENLLENYQPSEEVKQVVRSTPLILLVGISGAGKDSVKKLLHETGQYHDFVSYTTRPMRTNNGVPEQNGVEYHFIAIDEMQSLLEKGEMIEAKMYSGNIYGTGISELKAAEREGKVALNDIEVRGVKEYKDISPDVKAVFLLPPSYEEWRRRLETRYGNSNSAHDNLDQRLAAAKYELKEALERGYYIFVVNDALEETVNKIAAIVENTYSPEEQDLGKRLASQLFDDITKYLLEPELS